MSVLVVRRARGRNSSQYHMYATIAARVPVVLAATLHNDY